MKNPPLEVETALAVPVSRFKARREQRAVAARLRLIVAAGETFLEGGYADVAVQDIIARVRMSRRSFYEFFTSKEDVLLALFDETANRVKQQQKEDAERGLHAPFWPLKVGHEKAFQLLFAYVRVAVKFPVPSFQLAAAVGGKTRSRIEEHRWTLAKDLLEACPSGILNIDWVIGGMDHVVTRYSRIPAVRQALPMHEIELRRLFTEALP